SLRCSDDKVQFHPSMLPDILWMVDEFLPLLTTALRPAVTNSSTSKTSSSFPMRSWSVRKVSILDREQKTHTPLWEAFKEHAHIDRLEIHDAMFSAKKLIGPNTHTLADLKMSGNYI
ncbi:hypothetical protein BGX24_004153, partial [Mortierella sp. AD032]